MADSVIRKACDRCHAQKLSCKRIKDEPCERCLRLKTECTSSPSLRYKKQHNPNQTNLNQTLGQSILQQNQSQQHSNQLPSSETPPTGGRRSPKRRRTESDPSLVPPETGPIVPHTGGLSSKSHIAVAPGSVLEVGDFNFNFDQLGFFAPSQPEHLSHPGIPSSIGGIQSQVPFVDTWEQRLGPLSDPFQAAVTPNLHLQPDIHPPQQIVSQALQSSRGCVPEHNSSDKRPRHRARQRTRQISLRQIPLSTPQPREVASVHWMARLAEINSRLLDLSSTLPSQHESAQSGALPTGSRHQVINSQGFPVEEMFKLTCQVAEILEQPKLSFDAADSSTAPSRTSNVDSSDPGNCMFVLSTYVRLLDMYQKVFGLVYAELSQGEHESAFRFWKLPDVTIGPFAVESSAYLQMSLTIQLAEEFLSRLRKATIALDIENNYQKTGSSFAAVVETSFQAVKDQEQTLAKHLMDLRREIEVLLDG